MAAFLPGTASSIPLPDASADVAVSGRGRIRERLPVGADGSLVLQARAWAVKGRGPEAPETRVREDHAP